MRPRNRLLANLAWALGLHRSFLYGDFLSGSDAIANMRINWIRYGTKLHARGPAGVQLLGTRDSVVTEDDSVDVEFFPHAAHEHVAEPNHRDLYRLDAASDPDARYAVLRAAIIDPIPPREAGPVSERKDPVVFVLHGIRSGNDGWVDRVESIIRQQAPSAEVITSSYVYLSAWRFSLPHARRRNIGWFQTEYSRSLALHRDATFHFMGHSNGTYILGEALMKLSGMRFDRVALAGSVLPRSYPWHERFRRGRRHRPPNTRLRTGGLGGVETLTLDSGRRRWMNREV